MLLLHLAIAAVAEPANTGDQLGLLQQRVHKLEQQLLKLQQTVAALNDKDSWKDPRTWMNIKKEMTDFEVKKILGSPARVEQQIFTTWYYHQSTKLHSYVWFDDGRVLGWKLPE